LSQDKEIVKKGHSLYNLVPLAWLGLARFGLAWLWFTWFGLVGLGLAWLDLAWLGLALENFN
jgi:hypothetical protein